MDSDSGRNVGLASKKMVRPKKNDRRNKPV